jgi:hypothetical protein
MDWIIDILKAYGLAGVVIFSLAWLVRSLLQRNQTLSDARVTDRDTLNKLASDATKALDLISTATAERNKVTEELADAIDKQGNALVRHTDRVEFQFGALKDEVARHGVVITASSEATRIHSGLLTDIRNKIETIAAKPAKRKAVPK